MRRTLHCECVASIRIQKERATPVVLDVQMVCGKQHVRHSAIYGRVRYSACRQERASSAHLLYVKVRPERVACWIVPLPLTCNKEGTVGQADNTGRAEIEVDGRAHLLFVRIENLRGTSGHNDMTAICELRDVR